MSIKLVVFGLLLFSLSTLAQEKNVKIEYQKRQKINLGALMIDGELVTPGDFTVDDESEKASELMFKRKNYNDRLRINIEYVF